MMGTTPKWKGGFLIPIFGSLEAPHVVIASAGLVGSFQMANLSKESCLSAPGAEFAVGSPFPYAFERRDGRTVIGDFETVTSVVREEIGLFDDLPFSQIEMASFLGDRGLWDAAMDRCATVMDKSRAGAGTRFRESQAFRPYSHLGS